MATFAPRSPGVAVAVAGAHERARGEVAVSPRAAGIVMACFGLAILLLAFVLLSGNIKYAARAASALGTVTKLQFYPQQGSGTYAPIVEFTSATGQPLRIEGSVRTNPPGYAVGDRVRVLYDPADPARARLGSFVELSFPALLLGAVGALLGLVGGAVIAREKRRLAARAQVERDGRRVPAKIVKVVRDHSFGPTLYPWRVLCEWQDPQTQKIYKFRSEPVRADPRPHLNRATLDVTFDPAAPDHYLVDLSFLPKDG